jgi:hypothetical protein
MIRHPGRDFVHWPEANAAPSDREEGEDGRNSDLAREGHRSSDRGTKLRRPPLPAG